MKPEDFKDLAPVGEPTCDTIHAADGMLMGFTKKNIKPPTYGGETRCGKPAEALYAFVCDCGQVHYVCASCRVRWVENPRGALS